MSSKILMLEIIICVALKRESNEEFENILLKNKNINLHLVYTNVGKINAAYFLTKKIYELKMMNKNINLVINLGTAGGKNIQKGEMVICNKFIQRDFDLSSIGFKKGVNFFYCENNNKKESPFSNLILEHNEIININLKNVLCGTGDNFETIQNSHSKDINELNVSVQEMEAYALALVCKYENIDFCALKYVSDEISASTNNKQEDQFNDSLSTCAKKLSEALEKVLEKYYHQTAF